MLWEIMSQHISIGQYLDFFLRIAAACACGAIIGTERSRRLKEVGVRTHLLVCCTAALTILVSKYGFADLTNPGMAEKLGVHGADPSRIAAQVVSGISFLCAGVIFKQGSVVKGLTTAAGMWATAGIGLALGAGMYPLGFFTTAVVVLLQLLMHRLPSHNDQYQHNHIELTVADNADFGGILSRQLQNWHAQVIERTVRHNPDGTVTYALEVKMNNNISPEEISAFLEQNSAVSCFRQTSSN